MSKRTGYLLLSGVFLFQSLLFGDINCTSTGKKGIITNFFYQLSGSNDTMAVTSYDKSTFALNMITGSGSMLKDTNSASWPLYENTCDQILDIAFGGNRVVECIDTVQDKGQTTNQVCMIDLAKKTNAISFVSFPWNDSLKSIKNVFLIARDAVYADGSFYFACLDGQVVRWNIKDDSKSVLIPGVSGAVELSNFKTTGNGFPDTTKRVIGVEAIKGLLIVTTPAVTYSYNIVDSTWTAYSSTSLDAGTKINSFIATYVDGISAVHPLYSIAEVKKSNNQIDTALCKYCRKGSGWKVMLEKQIHGISFGPGGYVYTIQDSNNIKVYRDTLGDSDVVYRPISENSYNTSIDNRMLNDYGISKPEWINDFAFIPKTDTSGYFWVSTAEGLFLSDNEVPGKSRSPFILFKRAPNVKKELKQTYARPGVLNASSSHGRTIFVYNLSKDANVTIRVYDFNMDQVKTIIDKRPRKAGETGGPLGRSTIDGEDFWDGTNSSGMKVAPGVYYFKITTDIGEHSFGKIIVAK